MSGLGLGIIFLVFVWFCSALSFDVLAQSAHMTCLYTYKGISIRAWGAWLGFLSEICIILYTYLNLVARPIIISQYLVTVFDALIGETILSHSWFIILLNGIIVFPLTILRNIDALKYSSFFSLLCVLFTAAVVVVQLAQNAEISTNIGQVKDWPDSPSALISFGILVVSFCAHYNMPRMYQELSMHTPARMRVVIYVSTGACLILYALVGITGYFSCLTLTQGNVLNDYSPKSILVTVARLALVVALIFSTPLVLFACRRAFLSVFLPRRQHPPLWMWALISFVIIVTSSIIAYFLPSIDIIFGFSGAIIGVAFVFLIPGIFFVRFARADQNLMSLNLNDAEFVDRPSKRYMYVVGIFLIACACLLLPLGTAGSIYRIVNPPSTNSSCASVYYSLHNASLHTGLEL